MSKNLYAASQQWSTRPADERYTTLAAMLEGAQHDRKTCQRGIVAAKDLRAIAAGDELRVIGSSGVASGLTNWSYSQLATIAGAPHSQTHSNQDDRYALDQLAGRILQRARVAVAA